MVEPHLLVSLGRGEIDNEAVEEVGMADQEAEIMIASGGFSRHLPASDVGEDVGLSQRHLLLLLRRWGRDGLWAGGDGDGVELSSRNDRS